MFCRAPLHTNVYLGSHIVAVGSLSATCQESQGGRVGNLFFLTGPFAWLFLSVEFSYFSSSLLPYTGTSFWLTITISLWNRASVTWNAAWWSPACAVPKETRLCAPYVLSSNPEVQDSKHTVPVNETRSPPLFGWMVRSMERSIYKEYGKEGNDLLLPCVSRKQFGAACLGSRLEGGSRNRSL